MTFPHGSTAMAWPQDRRKLPSSLCWPAFWAEKSCENPDFEGQQKWGINRLWQDHHQKSYLHPWKLNILNTIRFGRWLSLGKWVTFQVAAVNFFGGVAWCHFTPFTSRRVCFSGCRLVRSKAFHGKKCKFLLERTRWTHVVYMNYHIWNMSHEYMGFHENFVGTLNFVGMNAFMGIHGISITYPRKSSREWKE